MKVQKEEKAIRTSSPLAWWLAARPKTQTGGDLRSCFLK